ncbi:MAG: hypothetical protein V7644_2761 [Actinomycetota bacterium]
MRKRKPSPSPEPSGREHLRGTFEQVPELYDRARPTYPPELLDHVAAFGPRILEIGPGTGQATRGLAARGVSVTAVELGARLARAARRNAPEAEIVNADFEVWEPERGDFDAVVAFTAFHWLDPESRYSKAVRLLRPGGTLGVVETALVLPEGGDPFWREMQEDYDAVTPSPDNRPPPDPSEVADLRVEFEQRAGLVEVEVRRYRWDVVYDADGWIDVIATYSPNIARAAEVRRELFGRLHARIAARPEGRIAAHYLATLTTGRTIVPPGGAKLG